MATAATPPAARSRAAGATLRGLALALAFSIQTTRAQDPPVKPCPPPSPTLASRGGEGTFTVTFQNDIDEEISLFWIDSHGKEVPQGTILPLAETTRPPLPRAAPRTAPQASPRALPAAPPPLARRCPRQGRGPSRGSSRAGGR